MSNPLRLHGLQHARLLCPSLCAGVCPNSCPLCLSSHSLLQPSPFAFNLSQHQGIFQWVGSLHQMAKVLELQVQNQSFQWIFRIISFRIDWFDLLEVQGTLESLLQHHNSEMSILQCIPFLMVQLSHPYMTNRKNHSFDYTDLCWKSNLYAF